MTLLQSQNKVHYRWYLKEFVAGFVEIKPLDVWTVVYKEGDKQEYDEVGDDDAAILLWLL